MTKLTRFAEQRVTETSCMAGLVAAYQRRHHLDDTAMMRHLGIDHHAFSRLVLAERPRANHRLEDVRKLSEYVGCDMSLLWGIISN